MDVEHKQILHAEDLNEDDVIMPGSVKPQKNIPIKIQGQTVGTGEVNADGEIIVTLDPTKIDAEEYKKMFGGYRIADVSLVLEHTNVFDEPQPNPGPGKTKRPFTLPGRT